MKTIYPVRFASICVLLAMIQSVTFAQEPGFSDEERRELEQLAAQYEFPIPDAPSYIELRIMLKQLRQYVFPVLSVDSERLVVCEVSDDPHLEAGDVIYLIQIGNSSNLLMTVVRNEGTADEMNPWTGPGGSSTVIVNPSIQKRPHSNPAYKKFSPEAAGRANMDPLDHSPQELEHPFSFRRDTRANWPNDCNTAPGAEDVLIFVPPHPDGSRHGGHARAK